MSSVRRSSRNGSGRSRNNGGGHRNNGRRNQNSGVSYGNAKSSYEKYVEKAKEALSYGDRISAENFYQYADHYRRIIIEFEIKREAAEEENSSNADNSNVEPTENAKKENKPENAEAVENKDKTTETEEAKPTNIPKELAL